MPDIHTVKLQPSLRKFYDPSSSTCSIWAFALTEAAKSNLADSLGDIPNPSQEWRNHFIAQFRAMRKVGYFKGCRIYFS